MMQIDLKNPSAITVENVRKLIASGDDSTHSQIRVSKDGLAYLSKVVGNMETENLAFRMETLQAGNDYVGLEASKDDAWVTRVYECLKQNWPTPISTYIDNF